MNWIKKNLAMIVAQLIGLSAFVFKILLSSKQDKDDRTKPVIDAVDAMEETKAAAIEEVQDLSDKREEHAENAAAISKEANERPKVESSNIDAAKGRWKD